MRLNLSMLLLICLAGPVYSQQVTRTPVGEIVNVKGKAYLREEGQKRMALSSRDKRRSLFAEQELVCGSQCQIIFTIGLVPIKLTEGTYLIPNRIRSPIPLPGIKAATVRRSAGAILLSPVEQGIGLVRPESFGFRWRKLKINHETINVAPLTISVNDCKTDRRIWSRPNIDYGPGSYVADDIREFLKQEQRRDSRTSAEVVLASASFDKKQRFCFDIISAFEEVQLEDELAEFKDYSDLARHAARAYIFYQHKLYSEAIDEFDAALQLSPNTDYLIADATKAHFQVGDEDGVVSLLQRLEKISSAGRLYREMLTLTGQRKNK